MTMKREEVARLRYLLERIAEYMQHTRDGGDEACSDHPDAPHGFDRNGSHTLDRYVCDCEGWEPDPAEDKILAMDATHFVRDNGPALLALADAVMGAPEVIVSEFMLEQIPESMDGAKFRRPLRGRA